MSVKSFLFGYSVISSARENAEKIINMCNGSAIPFSSVIFEGDEVLTFCVPLFYERKLIKLAKSKNIELCVISRRGIPALLFRHRCRAGLLVGLITALICFFYASGLVWDIRIDGAIRVNEQKLRATFNECGLRVGAKLCDIDADVLENQILILSDDISWVSINLLGNVASVEIRELDYAPTDEYGDALYSNVVASQEGVIVEFEDVKGQIVTEIGEAVCRDQLLISGIMGGEGLPTRLTDAHGRVFAEVEERIEIKIPQKYIKKVTKSNVKTEKSLFFFENEIKFFSNSRNLPNFYDTINIKENFYTINHKKLPLGIKTVKHVEYEKIEVTRTNEEMRALAYSELYRRLDLYYSDVEILSRSVSIIEEDAYFTLNCTLSCIKNIAQIKEIIVS